MNQKSNIKESDVKDPSRPLQLNIYFEKSYTLDGYFALPPPNYLVERYVKYIWYVKKT
jgi:hypothetical protein